MEETGTATFAAANRLEYAVCGGLAVAIHGRLRLTVDIDVVVAAQDIEKAAETAARVGFDDVSGWIHLPLNKLGINRLYRLNKISGAESLTLDLLESRFVPERDLLRTRSL